ncbi:chemotaxis protein CheA [Ligilactobacillus sp. WILCCON 0076]|uniref:Chemotaxis protein CheA n=1 Tax=Ligilactobacillus ubinensis TaxID=2876789 RepID=A0A9X2JKH7_9LACO|nr:chemotaxis protein CheA [Ligilactobacillus ubinensis]MCP0886227.1 chemotaxis protein CheA [Ligilactobacillus ubinensis]
MADDNSVYRDLFFEESDDNLQELNDSILELEQNPDNMELVNNIFRVAHTLKGMSATMGYDVMTKLTHKMEDIFDLFKSGKLKVTKDHVSLIFKCLDKLSELVDDLRDEKTLSDDQIKVLWDELDEVEKGVDARQSIDEKKSSSKETKKEVAELNGYFEKIEDADLDVIKKAQGEGYNVFTIAIRLDAKSLLKGPRVFLIMEKLDQEGDVIHSEPTTEILEDGDFDTDFKVIYVTKDTFDEVTKNINSNSEIDQVIVEEFDEEKIQKPKVSEEKDDDSKEIVAKPQDQLETRPKDSEKKKPAVKKENHHNNRNQSIRVDLNRLDSFLDLVSELVVYRNQLADAGKRNNADEVRDSMEQVSRLTSELQDLVLKIRMQQVSVVFNRYPRMIRDLANELQKEMELVVIGEETELDKTVVSELSEPMIHLLRNCADHGIEKPEVREKLGKPTKGTITLSAYQEGNKVIITLEDDGKGIDPDVIKESAQRKGINTDGMSDRDLQMLVFHPGFSTAKKITNISGRGVGLDAVQAKISELGGSLEMESKVNVGTRITIKLPLTLSIIQALMIRISDEDFAIPLDVVERVVMIKDDEIIQTRQNEVYRFQGKLIPIVRTNELLNLPKTESKNKFAIIVTIGAQYYGILADSLIGQQEIVIKKIDQILMDLNKYQGATILGNGAIALILDVNAICNEKKVAVK